MKQPWSIASFISPILIDMTAPMHDLTAFQRDLLHVLAGLDDGPKGLAIKAELESYYDEEINHGQLYPNLDTLVNRGFVEKGSIDKRTNSYTLTRRGERELKARHEWEAHHLGDLAADPETA